VKRFLLALQFLTILPVKIKSVIEEKDFGASLASFPVVGLLIGLLLTFAAASITFLPALVKSAMILALYIFITGAIHLDGFADTCDGLYGNRSIEKMLEIMRDSRIGAMGVIGIVLLLLLQFSAMASFPAEALWKILIVMCVFSRWSQVIACRSARYVRKEGKAKSFVEYSRSRDLVVGGIFTMAISVLLMSWKGAAICLISLVPVSGVIYYIKTKIGGMTGDTIGAVNEVAEVCVLVSGLIVMGIKL
jgi:adenosylcobinamide-GDP ribazoletransferase